MLIAVILALSCAAVLAMEIDTSAAQGASPPANQARVYYTRRYDDADKIKCSSSGGYFDWDSARQQNFCKPDWEVQAAKKQCLSTKVNKWSAKNSMCIYPGMYDDEIAASCKKDGGVYKHVGSGPQGYGCMTKEKIAADKKQCESAGGRYDDPSSAKPCTSAANVKAEKEAARQLAQNKADCIAEGGKFVHQVPRGLVCKDSAALDAMRANFETICAAKGGEYQVLRRNNSRCTVGSAHYFGLNDFEVRALNNLADAHGDDELAEE